MRNLLWIDGGAAVISGGFLLVMQGWLAPFYRMPAAVFVFMAVVSFVYGSYSLSLARRPTRPRWAIALLVAANLAWAPVCVGLAVYFRPAHWLGYAHLIGEAIFVAGLGLLEAKSFARLVAGTPVGRCARPGVDLVD